MEERKQTKPKTHQKKKTKKKKRIVLWIVLGILLLAVIGAGIYVWFVLKSPQSFFDPSVQVTAEATPETTPVFDIDAYLPTEEPGTTPIPTVPPTAVPEEPATPDPEVAVLPEATIAPVSKDPEQPSGIVNVALFGIDAYENGKTTSGSMPHTDANLVVAINFDTKEVSLISIARDILTTAPGHVGFYKFNGIFNVGGGMKNPKKGLELSCRAAEEWLGGISIPYYYGVDFQALVDMVDMIGGIDFDLDITLYTFDDRIIYPGKRHLDGQGVMAYMRMRKTAGGADTKRTARQRKMLVAIFQKLKKEGKFSMIPDILKTMGDNVYTNTTLSQTATLANFAKDINVDDIHTYSIQGKVKINYDWAFCFIDQQNRLDVIKKVYGIKASPMGVNSEEFEKFLHNTGFQAVRYLNNGKKLFDEIHKSTDVNNMSRAKKEAYAACWKDYTDLQSVYDLAQSFAQAHYDGNYTSEEKKQRDAYAEALTRQEGKLKKSATALNEAFGKPVKFVWNRSNDNWSGREGGINDVYVDFR